MLVGTHGLSGGDTARWAAKKSRRADCCEGDILSTKAQIIVFEFCSPVIDERIFQTKTDQKTLQRGAPVGGSAKYAAVCVCRVPGKFAGDPARFTVNKGSV